MRGRRRVRVLFYSVHTRRSHGAYVYVPTGSNGADHAMTIECTDRAWDEGWTHWVQPSTIDDGPPYRVFLSRGRSARSILKELPTKEAAAMWLIHAKL